MGMDTIRHIYSLKEFGPTFSADSVIYIIISMTTILNSLCCIHLYVGFFLVITFSVDQ